MTHLICASPAKINAAKSHICIIDRAGHEKPVTRMFSSLPKIDTKQGVDLAVVFQ
jgi:hypothetical protein